MQLESWRDVMVAYHSANFSSIPLNRKRMPLVDEWSKWNEELPEEPLYNEAQSGIGVLPGPASGVMFVDIDTDEPQLRKLLQEILPTSPVQRFGSKGVGIVYAYNEKIHSRKFRHIKVEIFADSGYVVVPPSYHEKNGKHYQWLGPSLLDFDRDLLPSFSESVIEKLEELNDLAGKNAEQKEKAGKGGRHDALLAQAFAALHKGKDYDTIAEELIEYDVKKHDPPWFVEERRGSNPEALFKVAKEFVKSAAKTFDKKNPIVESEPEAMREEKFEIRSYPKAHGVLEKIEMAISMSSYTAVPNMAFGSSLAIFSALVGNFYTFENTAANIYCLLLADSGTGKKFGIEKAKKLLAKHDRIGSANYISGPSVSKDLKDYIIRLDMSDEFSKPLGLIKNGGVWQMSIPQELCDLWSASTGQYLNNAAKKADAKALTLIEKPYLSILAATTIIDFKASVDRSLFTSGLLPRCLFFIDKATKDCRSRLDEAEIERIDRELSDFFLRWISNHPINEMNGAPLYPKRVPLDPEIVGYFDQKMRRFHEQTFDYLEGSAEKTMMSRKREQYKKLALLSALSRLEERPVIEKQDLDWAEEVFDVNFHNQTLFIKEASSENDQQAAKERLFSIIRQHPRISKRDLARRTQSFGKKQREMLLEDLIDAERVCEHISSVSKNGKRLKTYSAVQS